MTLTAVDNGIGARGARRCARMLLLLAVASSCASGSGKKRTREPKPVDPLDRPELVIGEYELAADAIVDGDTIKVKGLEQSLRLLGIDTEETFKEGQSPPGSDEDWQSYVTEMRGDSPKPVKMATPTGEAAKAWAEAFFKDVTRVQLERDHPAERRGRYGRVLAYVFVERGGERLNYNVECVRAGMSPYFTKYGFSRRFHKELVEAQAQARAAGRGIWDHQKRHYPDYEERLAWWEGRARFIQSFERDAEGRDDYVVLTRADALDRLKSHLGMEVVLLGSVVEIKTTSKGAHLVMLGRRHRDDFPVVFHHPELFERSNVARYQDEFIRVRGTVSTFRRRGGREQLEIVVEQLGQIQGP